MLKHRSARGSRRQPKRERGFALLLVFALAASVAILVYLEIPRVAFERQRDKEALLVDRGEQYARAIELYARKTHKYPQTLDELEQGQNIRFLRRRYKDPMTGKDEWRLIHMSANGQYADSKVHKPAGALGDEDSGPSVLASRIQGVGQSATLIPQDGQNVSAGLQKRASDRIIPGSNPGAGSADPTQSGSPDAPPDPNQPQNNAAQAGQPAATTPGGLANSARFPFPSQQATDSQQQPNTRNSAPPAFGSVLPAAQQDGANGNTANPGGSTQPQAMQAIQSILGGQRVAPAGGASGAGGVSGAGVAGAQAGAGAGSSLGAGLAGVATTVEMEGIRRYKEHSNYSEWEFIYDPKESQGQAQAQGQGAGNQQQGGAANAGGNTAGSSFGGMSGGGTPAPPFGSSGNAPKN